MTFSKIHSILGKPHYKTLEVPPPGLSKATKSELALANHEFSLMGIQFLASVLLDQECIFCLESA